MVTPGYAGSALTGQLFISLLNPAIGLLFAAAFFLLWLQRRERYVAWAAGAYVATAFAFLIQDVAPALPMELQRLPANAGFLLTGILFAAAIIGRYGLPVPWRAMAATAAVSLGVRSEEPTSELQSLMRRSYAGFCLKQKK